MNQACLLYYDDETDAELVDLVGGYTYQVPPAEIRPENKRRWFRAQDTLLAP